MRATGQDGWAGIISLFKEGQCNGVPGVERVTLTSKDTVEVLEMSPHPLHFMTNFDSRLKMHL
jgi:hypothetical protein